LVFGGGILWASILMIAWPISTYKLYFAVIVRILTGIGEGVTFPSMYHLMGIWYPRTEKSTIAAVMGMAPAFGTVIANGISPLIIRAFSWQSVFYISGGIGILWSLLWFLFVIAYPTDRKSYTLIPINESEVEYINKHKDFIGEAKATLSLKKVFSEKAFLVLGLNHFAYNWGYYVFASWLPTYLKEELGFDLNSAGIISFLPYLIMPCVGIPSGLLVDRAVKSNYMSLLTLRKIFQTMGTALPATFLIILSFAKPSTPVAVMLMMCSLISASFAVAGYVGNFIDISTKHSGVLYSFSNAFATIPGIFGVYITGFILDKTNNNWSIVFLLASSIYLLAAVFWNLFAKAEQIDFDSTEEESKPLVKSIQG